MERLVESLPHNNYLLISPDKRGLQGVIDNMIELGALLIRNVKIGAKEDDSCDLTAVQGDFWFHTDGVFKDKPPRWVLIQLLECQGGGSIELLPLKKYFKQLPNSKYFFGIGEEGIEKKLIQEEVFRYKENYMRPIKSLQNFDKLKNEIAQIAQKETIQLGELKLNEILIIDNWSILHRRQSFIGTRTIQRIWMK